jgi:Cytosine/adenosine deaminases
MNMDERFIRRAIELAIVARNSGNEPFGAVLAKDGEIVMEGENQINSGFDPTYHAEIGLIRKFCAENEVTDLSEYTLYSSCEPCAMCSAAMVWTKLGRLVYSVAHDQLAVIAGSNIMIPCAEVFARSPHKTELTERLLNEEGLKAFEGYTFN